jgi:hypothetical protein
MGLPMFKGEKFCSFAIWIVDVASISPKGHDGMDNQMR